MNCCHATQINMLYAMLYAILFTNVLKLKYHLVVVISYHLHVRAYMLHVDLRCK